MSRRRAIALLALALAPGALAQRISGAAGASGRFGAPGGISISFTPTARSHSAFTPGLSRNAIFLGTPWFGDYQSGTVQPQTQPIILIEPQPVASPAVEEIKPSSSLLIEWRGDRFVRFSGSETAERTDAGQEDYAEAKAPATIERQGPAPADRELAPAGLVFRDGHREDVREYPIVGSVMYAQGDYWANGYWTKQIQMSSLNLPETIRLNQQRGVAFRLPSAPNEVVTRP